MPYTKNHWIFPTALQGGENNWQKLGEGQWLPRALDVESRVWMWTWWAQLQTRRSFVVHKEFQILYPKPGAVRWALAQLSGDLGSISFSAASLLGGWAMASKVCALFRWSEMPTWLLSAEPAVCRCPWYWRHSCLTVSGGASLGHFQEHID